MAADKRPSWRGRLEVTEKMLRKKTLDYKKTLEKHLQMSRDSAAAAQLTLLKGFGPSNQWATSA